MQLFIVRHGQTDFNAEHRYLGALDPALNSVGLAQAHALHAVLPESIETVVCSPLFRARQTADVVCRLRGLTPVINPAFRERHVGVFEGLTQQEAQTRHPDLWRDNITRQWRRAPTGGETIVEVIDRVALGLQQLSKQFARRRVALIAHGFVAKVARALTGPGFGDFFEWQLDNGAVYETALHEGQALQRPDF